MEVMHWLCIRINDVAFGSMKCIDKMHNTHTQIQTLYKCELYEDVFAYSLDLTSTQKH